MKTVTAVPETIVLDNPFTVAYTFGRTESPILFAKFIFVSPDAFVQLVAPCVLIGLFVGGFAEFVISFRVIV